MRTEFSNDQGLPAQVQRNRLVRGKHDIDQAPQVNERNFLGKVNG